MKCPITGFDCSCEERCDLEAKCQDAGRTIDVRMPATACFDALGAQNVARACDSLGASLHSMLASVDRIMGPDACPHCKARLVATAFVAQAHGAFDLGREDLCAVFAAAIADVLGAGDPDGEDEARAPPLH